MQRPPIVSSDEFHAALATVRAAEKAHTEAADALAAARRRLPQTPVEKAYRFTGPGGELDLPALFDGRRQLIVYHHMLKPDDASPCTGCGMVGDQMPHLAHLHARDTTLVFVSRAPFEQIEAFRERMGWSVPWFHTGDDFNADHGVTSGFGLNVFLRDEGRVLRTYFTTGRGVETLGTAFTLLDVTPLGRQEEWEDAPRYVEQSPPYRWWRLHDEY